jgi:DNA-binding Lrp family transcriptional regulator
MAKAYVLVETAVGKTKDVVNALKLVEGVKTADPVTGPYDVIALIEQADINAIGNLVTGKIHPVNGVLRTVTCIAMELAS